jgi:hypothetical protein
MARAKQVLILLASWAIFSFGHLISWPMRWFRWGWLYPIYNRLMVTSHNVQGPSARGPWSEMKPK